MTPDNWNKLARSIGYASEEDLLRDWYESQRMSITNIAVRIGVGQSTVIRRLELYKIPRRERGGANNNAGLKLKLHYVDQRRVFIGDDNRRLSMQLNVGYSTLYKYRRGVKEQ